MKNTKNPYPPHHQLEHIQTDTLNNPTLQSTHWQPSDQPSSSTPIECQVTVDQQAINVDLLDQVGNFEITQQDLISVISNQTTAYSLKKNYSSMDWFFQCITKHYFDFSSRATRQEFWGFIFIAILISFFTTTTDAIFGISALTYTVNALLVVPLFAAGARRLHDIGLSGWWQILYFSIFGILFLLLMWLRKSEQQNNQYGEFMT